MHVADLLLYSDRREECTLNRSWNDSSRPFSMMGGPGWPDRPVSSFDIPTYPHLQAQTDSATRANQDDHGRIGLLGQGTSWAIYSGKHISRRHSSGPHSYVIPGLIPITWPCGSDIDLNDISQAGHKASSYPDSPKPAAPKAWADIEGPRPEFGQGQEPDPDSPAFYERPLTRSDHRRTFASKSQLSDSLNHSTKRARAPPPCWVE